jgi:hypothetical protein
MPGKRLSMRTIREVFASASGPRTAITHGGAEPGAEPRLEVAQALRSTSPFVGLAGVSTKIRSYSAFCARSFGGGADSRQIGAIGEAEGGDTEGAHLVLRQGLRPAVERVAMRNCVPGA